MADIDYKNEIEELKKQFDDLKKVVSQPTAHQKANSRYEKRQNRFMLRIPEHEVELWEHLKEQPNMNQYLKALIAKDIGYKTWEHFKGMTPTEEYRKDWDDEKHSKKFKSKLMQIQTWEQLNDFVDDNVMTDSEWDQVENLFNFEGNPSGIAYDLFALGVLPFDVWNKKAIKNKVVDILDNAQLDYDIDWDKFSESVLKKKLLKKTNIGDKDSALNTHLKLYAIDDAAILKLFKIDYKGE